MPSELDTGLANCSSSDSLRTVGGPGLHPSSTAPVTIVQSRSLQWLPLTLRPKLSLTSARCHNLDAIVVKIRENYPIYIRICVGTQDNQTRGDNATSRKTSNIPHSPHGQMMGSKVSSHVTCFICGYVVCTILDSCSCL